MPARRILYTGPCLSGVSTTLAVLAARHKIELKSPRGPRLGFEIETADRRRVFIQSDDRSSSVFPDVAIDHLEPHIEYMRRVDGIVFVVDSQIERAEANAGRLKRVETELANVGRTPNDVPVVFQCNKRELPRSESVDALRSNLHWPRCDFVSSTARRGEGVVESLELILAMLGAAQPPSGC